MIDFKRYQALSQQENWTAIHALLDDVRANAVTQGEISCEVCFRVSTLRKQGRYNEALNLLRERGHLYTSQSLAAHDMARVLLKLGREQDALDAMGGSPYEAEMTSCPMLAMDAKFFHAVLLAKSGDPSARDLLEDIPNDYIQVTIDCDDLITKSDVVASLGER